MEFKQEGNLGKIDLLQRHLMLKLMESENGVVVLSEEEMREVKDQLSKFRHVLSNLNLYANMLEFDQYRALVSIINELKPYHQDYSNNDSK